MALERSHQTVAVALALLVALLLAGCGGSSSDSAKTTATVAPPTTATTDSTKPAKFTPAQTARVRKASQSFVSAVTIFLSRLNRCPASKSRGTCVRRAADRAERVVARTRRTVRTLTAAVGPDCALQLDDVSSKITDVTDVLSPMAEATQRGELRDAGRLGVNAQTAVRSFASSSVILERAC
jgi:hypothetical protein